MGDRHGGRFARRGRTLNPSRPQVDAHHGVGLRWRARAKEFAPREKALLGEGLPTRRTSEGICPAQERSPRRKPPDTAHERRDLPHAGTRPTAKAFRRGAQAKGFAPRRNAPHGEGLPTRREGERICPAREGSPRRKPPDTARRRRDLPAQEHAPRRRPPDTAHERKNLPRAGTRPAAKASRHGTKAKRFAPRRNAPHGESLPTRRTSEGICPTGFAFVPRADERRAAHDRRTAEKHPFGGVAPTACGRCRVHSPKKNKTTP